MTPTVHKPTHPPHHKHTPLQYHHVTIDGTGTKSYATPAQYEHAVLHVLKRIHHSHTGKAVFYEFAVRSKHHLKIVPYEMAVLNAFASPTDPLHATPKGQPERSGANGSILLDGHGKKILALGGGCDSMIYFTPKMFTKYCNHHKHAHRSGAQPDEVLFHEMVHATRQMRGLLNSLPLGYMYDTEEEFFAILVANIYASETGRPVDLRSDHHGFEHLLTDSNKKFLPKKDITDYRYRLVAKLVREEPKMALALSAVHHAHFNPIRRYYALQHTATHKTHTLHSTPHASHASHHP